MTPVSLDEMQNIRLMDRVDSKFVTSQSKLPELLQKAAQFSYRVQEIDGVRMAAYSTQYLDTPELSMYEMHQNGRLNRQKIRIRSYQNSNISFLEVKNKSNKGRTTKLRVLTDSSHVDSVDELDEGMTFLADQTQFKIEDLLPSLANSFHRITLVNDELTERITIDVDISFQNYSTGIKKQVDDLMIIELKQDGSKHSDFKDILTDLRIKSIKLSKYCIGTVLTNPNCKYNRYKKKSRLINKLINLNTNDSN